MSTLENTIEKVISEGVSDEKKEIQHEVPASGDAAPAAKMKTDPDAEKHASDAAKKAGDATKPAAKTNAASKQDPIEEPSDGVTKVDKTTIPNQEEVEDDSETPSLEEMSKADLLKHAVVSMKEMDAKTLKATYAGLSENDEDDGDGEETSESLSRNALIRKVVESLKDKSVKEVQSFIESLDPAVGDPAKDATEGDRDEDKGNSKATQKQTTPVESKQEEEDEEEEEEEVKKESYEVDMTDDIEALVADEDLSQEFKTKAKTIFEAAVATNV